MTDMADTVTPEGTFVRLRGGCQCGAVRYELSSAPVEISLCHCRMCQKAGGTPFMAFARVPIEAVRFTRGVPAIFRSSSIASRGFCAACGTPLTYQGDPAFLSFTTGSFDDPSRIVPETVVGIEGLLEWSEHIGALPTQTTEAAMGPGGAGGFTDFQHPDHDT